MNRKEIERLLYDAPISEVTDYLLNCRDNEELYVYAFNYNWENGFEIPGIILNNPVCSFHTALLIFWRAEGDSYLRNKAEDKDLPEWSLFIAKLYNDIRLGKYPPDCFQFTVPLTKVQRYKLEKVIAEEDRLFLEDAQGTDLDIEI